MENHLKRVLRLVQKTGDTMVVVDKEGDEAFVVMDLERYEQLLDVDSTETQSRSRSELHSQQDYLESEEKEDIPSRLPDIWDVMQGADDDGETWDIDQLSEAEFKDLEKQYEAFANRHVQEAIEETTQTHNTEESSSEDEYGEEQFYLEPVE